MTYRVKEVFYTLQGEGARAGRPAVFCRFSGCNLWSGREEHRARAVCRFCDTDFRDSDGEGGGVFNDGRALADHVAGFWPQGSRGGRPYVVCTGGEPLLQVDVSLVDALHAHGFEVAVETNGTQPAVAGLDWITVSPKAGARLHLRAGHEVKFVVPQDGQDPEALADGLDFEHHFVQPMDVPNDQALSAANTGLAVEYCLAHPRWRLSVQTHKTLGIR